MSCRLESLFVLILIFIFPIAFIVACGCNNDDDQTLSGGVGDVGELDDDTDEPVFDDDAGDDDTGSDDDTEGGVVESYSFLIAPIGQNGVRDGDLSAVVDDQAGVPGDVLPYIGILCGSISGCVENTQDVQWSTSNEDLATVDDNGLVTLIDYGRVEVIGVAIIQNESGDEFPQEDRAVIYIQADILVLDRNGRIGAIDYSTGEFELSAVASALPHPSEDFLIAGHRAYVIGLDGAEGNGVLHAPLLVDSSGETAMLDYIESDATAHLQVVARNNALLTMTSVDHEIIWFADIPTAHFSGAIRTPSGSTPFGVTTANIGAGTTFITFTYEDGDGNFGDGEIEVRDDLNLIYSTVETTVNPRYFAPSRFAQKYYAICGGNQTDSFGLIEVFNLDFVNIGAIDLGGYPEAFAVTEQHLVVGDKTKPQIFALNTDTDSLMDFDPSEDVQFSLGLPEGTGVRAIYYDESRELIYVAVAPEYVTIIDAENWEILDTYTLEGYDIADVASW